MKNKNIIIIAGTILIVGILAVVGINLGKNSGKGLSDETLDLIQKNEQIEIEIAVPDYIEDEQGTQSLITWIKLAELGTYQTTLRTPMENALGVKAIDGMDWIKSGMLYENNAGKIDANNTLKNALQNKEFRTAVDNDEIITQLADAALNTFSDLESDEEMTNFYIAINAYFNLLPATEEGYANPQSALTRAEFMSMVMRAETPVDAGYKVSDEFKASVGESDYSIYAERVMQSAYLTTADKSLNNQTFNGNISRAEAVYMLMNHYYADELNSLDISKAKLDDTKDGGDIAKAQGYTKDYGKSYEITYSINNPEAGVPTDIYKALVLAESKGLIDSETRFDSATTLEESVELLVNIYKTLPIDEVESNSTDLGNDEYKQNTETGTLEEGSSGYHYADSWKELEEDMEDGVPGELHYNEDGTTYIIWYDGTRYDLFDMLPNGQLYHGVSEADAQKVIEEFCQ